jgi:hypothetical protein
VLREMKSKYSMLSVVVALVIAMSSTSAVVWPAYAIDAEAEQSSGPLTPSVTSPLLDALAFAPPEIIAFEFTDWTALKALHGGADITSASPLAERQRLVLEMVNSEASQFEFGLGRLATWPELWGWDNTDLAWEATWVAAPGTRSWVLRFRDGWDPKPFMARLEGYGYSRTEKPHGTLYSDAPDFHPDPDTEAILEVEERLTYEPGSVAISSDGQTVAIRVLRDRADRILKTSARADPVAVAASPFGRVAVALGRPITAFLMDGDSACSDVGLGYADRDRDALLFGDRATRPTSVGPLHPYEAFGIGYERAGPGEPAVGRYAFAYKRAKQAKADYAGRRALMDEGYSSLSGRPAQDVAPDHSGASTDRRTLVLDVAVLDDAPKLLFDPLGRPSLSPVACA